MMEGRVSLREKIILGILVLLLISGGVWRAVQFSAPEPEIIQIGQGGSSLEEEISEVSEPEMITVHLVGAVNKPGVYQLPVGSRVYELLEISGGFNNEADQETVNQARPLLDGEQIYINSIGEAAAPASAVGAANKININQASVQELTSLPGIGDVRANQIISYREEHGYFTSLDQIMDVSGIGESTFENIADQITIY